MLLDNLFKQTNKDQFITRFFILYPTLDPIREKYKSKIKLNLYIENIKNEYKKVFDEIINTEKSNSDLVIHIEYKEDDDKYDVHGIKDNDNESYSLELTPWAEWLGSEIVIPDDMNDIDFLCHCVWEMTFHGFTDKNVQEVKDELNRRITDIKKQQQKTVTLDDVMKSLHDKVFNEE